MRELAGETRRGAGLIHAPVHLREFLELCARTLVCPEPIVEIGAFQVSGQEAIADLRPLFPGKNYIGCDIPVQSTANLPENVLIGFSDQMDLSKLGDYAGVLGMTIVESR